MGELFECVFAVQWHLAQMLAEVPLTAEQRRRAAEVVIGQLEGSDDWIVVTCALQTLASFTSDGTVGRDVLVRELERRAADPRKAVRSRVATLRRALDSTPTSTR